MIAPNKNIPDNGGSSAREEVVRARKTLLNDGKELSTFKERGLNPDTIEAAFVGYEPEVYFKGNDGRGYKGPAFTYPCVGGGRLLAIHYKSVERDDKGKRRSVASVAPRSREGTVPESQNCRRGQRSEEGSKCRTTR